MTDDLTITLKNYRCFNDIHPAILDIGPGFTALVGPNNSGKTSFLRFFFEMRQLLRVVGPNDAFIQMIRGNLRSIQQDGLVDQSEIACDWNTRDISIDISYGKAQAERQGITLVSPRLATQAWRVDGTWGRGETIRNVGLKGSLVQGEHLADVELGSLFRRTAPLGYILYIGPFRNAINQGAQSYYDVAVGTHFIDTWYQWKSGPNKQQNRRIEEVTEDIRGVFGFDKLEINAAHGAKALQVIVDRKPYRLEEHGAGLSQFVLVFGNAAIQSPAYILIDEPELNLHPTLQRNFLTRLASYASEGIIFATHSIGLLSVT